jgi:hypothetical protein
MAFLIKRETGAGSTSGGKNLNKSSRRFTKDDISAPTLLPCGESHSLLSSTVTLNEAMKGHKRGKSEPFPAGRGGWASLIGGRWGSGITKLVISGVYNSRSTTDSGVPAQPGSQSIQIIFPQVNKDKCKSNMPNDYSRLNIILQLYLQLRILNTLLSGSRGLPMSPPQTHAPNHLHLR